MRTFMVRAALLAATVVLVGEPMMAPAQDQAILQPGTRSRPMQQATPPQQSTPTIPGRIVVPPPTEQPPVVFVPSQPRRFEQAPPPPERYVQPGIEGLYAQLRAYRGKGRDPKLGRYQPYTSPATPPDPTRFRTRQIVVKFVEGSGVRLREGNLVVSEEPAAIETRERLTRNGVEPQTVAADLEVFKRAIGSVRGFAGRAAPDVDELDLHRLRQAAERGTRLEQPDLNLFYYAHLPEIPPEDAQRLLQDLQRLRTVEAAYFQPIPFEAADKPPTTTLNVFPSQGYLRPAPLGIDVDYARNFAGGRGEGVRIVDVEFGWNINNEDLPQLFLRHGTNFGGDHGTAVLGTLVAEENSFGATGIVPQALAGWSSVSGVNWNTGEVYFYSVAAAIVTSANYLRAGDITLIELHFASNAGPPPNNCNRPQWGYVAVESAPFEHAAISHVTGAGVVVVEAAGNGQQMVVPASTRDSGAIVVGASNGAPVSAIGSMDPLVRAPACFTNFGPRVNVHAWGGFVGTLGYGMSLFRRIDAAGNPILGANGMPILDSLPDPMLRGNGNDGDQWYTRTFDGTSSASPIVTGAAALIQSIRAAAGHALLSPIEMRTLLASTGTPQTADPKNIGPLPNLRAALTGMFPDHARFASQSGTTPAGPLMPGANFNVTVSFTNAGGQSWAGAHTVQISPTQTGPSPFGTQSVAVGSPGAPVNPNGTATATFTLRAPTTPGVYPLGFWLRAPTGSSLATGPSQQIIVGAPPNDTATITFVQAPGQIRMGIPALVMVVANNTGATVWNAQTRHNLRIWNPTQNLTLSSFNIPVTGTVAPGQNFTFAFQVTCRATGFASYSMQLESSQASVSQATGRTVSCTQ